MLQPVTLLRFRETQNAAIIQAKKDFQHYCVITKMSPEDRPTTRGYELDGAHILPRSEFPEVSRCVDNILPMIRRRHNWRNGDQVNGPGCFDLMECTSLAPTRKPMDKIRWLIQNMHEDFRPSVFDRLRKLFIEGSKLYGSKIILRRDEALKILEAAE